MGKDLNGKELGTGLSQRKDGRYNARAVINGITINIYGNKLSELKRDFVEEKSRVLRCEYNIRPNITLNDWFEEWFTCVKSPMLKGEVNRVNYKRKIKNTFCAILGEKRLADISQINMQTAANELVDEKGYSIRLVRECISTMKECFNSAIANRLINFNPCIDVTVKNLNLPKDERVVLSQAEQETFLEFAKNSFYYEAYQILLSTGMRAGEFAGLQWEDINFQDEYIEIKRSLTSAYVNGKKILEFTTPKTINSYRKIPFFDGTEELLKIWKQKQDDKRKELGNRWRCPKELGNLVFTTTMGSPATRYVLQRDLQQILSNINYAQQYEASLKGLPYRPFKKVHPHAFRHTFATRCFEKKLSPLFIMKVMGHSKYATTVSYTHLLDEFNQEEIQKAGTFIGVA